MADDYELKDALRSSIEQRYPKPKKMATRDIPRELRERIAQLEAEIARKDAALLELAEALETESKAVLATQHYDLSNEWARLAIRARAALADAGREG